MNAEEATLPNQGPTVTDHGPRIPGPGRDSNEQGPPDNQGQIQYYGRSELPRREVALHRFSPKRKTTLIALSLVAALTLLAATAWSAASGLNNAANLAQEPAASGGATVEETANAARTRTLGLAAGSLAALALMIFVILRIGPRVVALEFWIRRMGAGDLEHPVTPTGNDEITEIFYDLEVLRRQSLRAQRLDMVQQLSEDLQRKNTELETVLTELHTTQDQVISHQKLAELGELTAGVAHEIRNPLNLIQNFARTSGEMMNELKKVVAELEGPPDEEQAALLEELTSELDGNMSRLRQHGDRANRIIQDMLAMGRNSTGNRHTVTINDLVEDHAMLAYHSAKSRDPEFNMKIVRQYDPATGEASIVSEDIGRVILNLVSNACYASNERSKAEEGHEPTLWLTTDRDEDRIQIKIRDNGNGMPPEVMEKIFNPFFTTKPTDRGTGLGLSLSNDIVREHGGTITPESQPGEYAQFTIRIPILPQEMDTP